MRMIWVVEDDASVREMVLYTLRSTGFEACGFEDGISFFESFDKQKEDVELVLLDIMLPKMSGIEILKRIRFNDDTPIIMTTAKGQEYDIIQCLDLGADDYLVKPFGMMEMVSRIKAVLRRVAKDCEPSILKDEDLVLDCKQYQVFLHDEPIELTYKEFELLRLFMSHPNRVFTRVQLYEKIWQDEYLKESRTIDMHIRTLRMKLLDYGDRIETIRNVGYRWEGNDSYGK